MSSLKLLVTSSIALFHHRVSSVTTPWVLPRFWVFNCTLAFLEDLGFLWVYWNEVKSIFPVISTAIGAVINYLSIDLLISYNFSDQVGVSSAALDRVRGPDLHVYIDSVNRDVIWGLLWPHGMPQEIIGIMKLLYSDTLSAVRMNGMTSEWFSVDRAAVGSGSVSKTDGQNPERNCEPRTLRC